MTTPAGALSSSGHSWYCNKEHIDETNRYRFWIVRSDGDRPTRADFTTLFSFDQTEGEYPTALVQGTDGNFYGTTSTAGPNPNARWHGLQKHPERHADDAPQVLRPKR